MPLSISEYLTVEHICEGSLADKDIKLILLSISLSKIAYMYILNFIMMQLFKNKHFIILLI